MSNDFPDLGEFTDVTVAVRLFVHGVAARFDVTEGLASVNSLLRTTGTS